MITAEQETKLRALLKRNLLDEEQLADEEPWGQDGSMNCFDNGKPFGAHDLAEEIFEIIGQ
jgi:hypothetical protein